MPWKELIHIPPCLITGASVFDANRQKEDIASVKRTKRRFTAVVSREEDWWVGFILEIPGVNCQGRTRMELMGNLRSALTEALEIRRELTLADTSRNYEEQAVLV